MKRNWVPLGAGIALVVALLVVLIFVVFIPNPTEESNRQGLVVQRQNERKTQLKLYAFICAQAQTQANAFRFRQSTPKGKIEGVRHFLTRMLAQQQTLRLSKGLRCPSNPGFPSFASQIRRGLAQIREILARYSEEVKQPISTGLGNPEPGEPPLSLPMPIRRSLEKAAPVRTEHEEVGPTRLPGPKPTAPPSFQIPRAELPVEEAPPTTIGGAEALGALSPIEVPICSIVRALAALC